MERDPRSVAPEAFQPVELALLVDENVNDDVDEVHQDPIGDATPLDVFRLATRLREQPFLDRVGDRQGLARRRPVANDEIVGEVAKAPEVKNENVFSLFVGRGIDDLFQYGSQLPTSSEYNRCL